MLIALALILGGPVREPPVIPVGFDAYRMWDRWPFLRIGVRAYMRSTYDRRGGNEAADASHFLYQLADDRNVSLDVEGPGVLYFVRTNHWHGSPWHYEVNKQDHVIRETSTADPDHPVENSTFLPAEVFPKPLAWTWSDTKGADLSWLPIPFEHSFRMSYSRTHYGTGYYIYHQFARGAAKLSRPIETWDGKTPPPADVIKLIQKSGKDITDRPEAGENRKGIVERTGQYGAGEPVVLQGPAMIRAIEFSAPREAVTGLERCRIRITWDDRTAPSVDAPLPLFFGAGTLYNRDAREYLVRAFPVNIRFDSREVHLACCFPMPFFRSAKIELLGDVPNVRWRVRMHALDARPGDVGYFHATYSNHPTPIAGNDLTLLDTTGVEGSREWAGHFIGMSWIFSHNANLGTLEGDPRFFFDDSQTPQGQGTGTEEWGGGGDYWGGRNMTLPFAGHPVGAPSAKDAISDKDKIESAYRFLLADLMPFGRNARICLEHGGTNESKEHYESIVYWYGWPKAAMVETGSLQIGDLESERTHAYSSPYASPPYQITSRYELGVDTLNGNEIYPTHSDTGRITTQSSEFTLKIDPNNRGVMLRRKLDYAYPNQQAEVLIKEDRVPARFKAWYIAGTWYTAGSNTCVYSNPREELGPTQHTVQTSNRRFRDDEFLIPAQYTRGRSQIRVRIEFTPHPRPLFPGHPIPPLAWSEIRYSAYSFVMP